jgi:hypothetical protein
LLTGSRCPRLRPYDIAEIASGRHQLDDFVRRYIHEHLSYRFIMLPDVPSHGRSSSRSGRARGDAACRC